MTNFSISLNSLTAFQYATTLIMNPLVRYSTLAVRNCEVKPVIKFLNSALALIKYGYTIRGLFKSLGFQASKTYDEKLRRVGNLSYKGLYL